MRADRVAPHSPSPSRNAATARGVKRGASESASPEAPEQKEWTILGFFNGNNDLEPYITNGLLQAERVGKNDNVNFVTQLARAPQDVVHGDGDGPTRIDGDWVGVRRYECRFSGRDERHKLRSKVVEELPGFTDMGAPNTLADFLQWGIKNYPAKHYMVVFNNHGAGFRGVSFDDVHESNLDPSEMRQVLQHVQKETGVKPDVLLFDACEMGQAEVAYELRDTAGFLVAAEDLTGAPGMPYADIVAKAAFDENVSGRDMAAHIVEASGDDQSFRMVEGLDEAAGQLAAIDLSKMDALRSACDTLSRVLRKGGIPRQRLVEIVKRTKKFQGPSKPDKDFRDLGDFAKNILNSRHVRNDDVREAAQGVLAALDNAVLANQTEGDGMGKTHGLSVYLPYDGGRHPKRPRITDPYGYGKLEMSKDGEWDELIAHMNPRRPRPSEA